ncbi:MAG: M28 family peptidase [Candidatus Obscuribacterales bacterium]|nr:M28 family peptidase [Candidatus Obscuribacterales bacterium]
MFGFPGKSYKGPLPTLTESEQELSCKLSNHVWMLAGDIGARSLTSAPDNLEKAAQYIEHVLKSYGYVPKAQEFTAETFVHRKQEPSGDDLKFPYAMEKITHKTRNIIAELPGDEAHKDCIIVGAHYDSVFDCPAANDNGSGVAALLEISRLLQAAQLKRTVRFVAFTNEEPPFFRTEQMGSHKYAQLCHQNNDKVAAMISLETIGFYTDEPNSQQFPHSILRLLYPTTGNFVSFVSNLQSQSLLTKCISAFRQTTKFPSEGVALPAVVPGIDFSDHRPFWQLGYQAIMITDTAHLRYPHYHEAEDTPEKIDYDKFALVVAGLTRMIGALSCGA